MDDANRDTAGNYDTARRELVADLRRRLDVDERALAAIESVPRHAFVPEDRQSSAYADRPLPIGHDQTISAPHIVALMTDLLDVEPGDRVLEVGTGCGYHAAVVAEIVGSENVYSVEYVPELAEAARERLHWLGYDVVVDAGDGRTAFPDEAAFDAAYLTCAPADGVPDSIVDRVRTGGRVVAPIGPAGKQRLVRLTVGEEGIGREDYGGVRFVPMR
ncbi:protein-L-isoaspartate(D-aspartate) O-methyltransferase [Halorubrum sp. N11]|uniref:protein-L-isoaspartate(D-aspartate) O-methyltransferase n=1 Tax=Halorubrum sp. N11 TaxID=3402276 RepID=UPI003EBE35C7